MSASTASNAFQDELLKIIKENKRRRPVVAVKAEELLTKYRGYKDEKSQNPAFDVTKRRISALTSEIIDFLDELNEKRLDDLEIIVAKIYDHLKEPIPDWDDLSEAMKLAEGRGYFNEHLKSLLISRPNDNEARIDMAEKLELFAAGISIKK